MRNRNWLFAIVIVILFGAFSASVSQEISSNTVRELRFRCIGPAVTGGRIHDVEAVPEDPATVYVATASGGLWKTTNNGTTWQPIFDNMPVSTFGDVAIAPSNPNVIWAGTGEQNNRQSTSWGNGVYVSHDGGKTWRHTGLVSTRHIGKIEVHPQNPDIAYVAALGNLWKPNPERGVFVTRDGGKTWSKSLFINEVTGVVDLVMNPRNPEILFAAAYQRMRKTWGFNGGGPGSGIYRTKDGGKSWEKLTNGLPAGDKGRIGLAISHSNPDVVYAIVEHEKEGGVYRSTDGGNSWVKMNSLNPRPMYYSEIFVDPVEENRVYVLATEFYMSENGGKTFRVMPTRPTYDVGVHSDHHALWIDPNNTRHFFLAGDAGLHETWDRGETYRRINNFPIGQFYAIGVDMSDPYLIYGGMQDNHSWVGPSATRRWIGILNDDWKQIGFGDGMYQQPDPTSKRYVYTNAQNGVLTRLDGITGDRLDIRPYPPPGEKPYRFDWVTPSLLSQHDPKTFYFGGNRLFISHDRGLTFVPTEDLTRQIDREQLEIMGVTGKDIKISKNDGTASYGEIVAIAESPLNPNILWVGTDDGNLQVSRDGGKSWTNVAANVKGVKDGTYVSRIVASRQSPGTAYVAFDAHRDGDFAPYVFKTTDFGKTWRSLTAGLPQEGSVRVLVEHHREPNLLFLGTEHALFFSINAGEMWLKFDSNLPTTLYFDLKIHPRDNDLIVATHGRSIWILDDLTPLVDFASGKIQKPVHLCAIQPATIFQYWKTTSYRGQAAFAGENPPFGAGINYYLSEAVDSVNIIIRNKAHQEVRRLTGRGEKGVIHRIYWDLRHEPPPIPGDRPRQPGVQPSKTVLPHLPHPVTPQGPFVSPGVYTVTLKAGPYFVSQSVQVKGDPLMPLTQTQWEERERFLVQVLQLQKEIFNGEQEIKKLQREVQKRKITLSTEQNDSLKSRVSRWRRLRSNIYRLAADINGDAVRQGSLYPPTKTHYMRKAVMEKQLATEKQRLAEIKKWIKEM